MGQTMKLLLLLALLLTLNSCQNPSRLQAAPSGLFVDSNGSPRAKHLGFDVPDRLLALADEVIE